MTDPSADTKFLQLQLQNLLDGMKEISHEINNTIGVMRMAVYLMDTTKPPPEKRTQYVKALNESLDKIEAGIKRLKTLRQDPTTQLSDIPPPEKDPQ